MLIQSPMTFYEGWGWHNHHTSGGHGPDAAKDMRPTYPRDVPVPELDSFRIKRKPLKREKCDEEAEPDSREETSQKADSDRGTDPTPAWKRLVEGRRETRRRRLCGMFLFHEPAAHGPGVCQTCCQKWGLCPPNKLIHIAISSVI